MATAHFDVFDVNGNLILSLSDRVAGGITVVNTGKSNGSYTASVPSGMSVEFAFSSLTSVPSSGSPSRVPNITVSGNTITWNYTVSGQSNNFSVNIMVVIF